jgi:CopG family nickel-responsive transcriptional regulator
MGVVTLIYNHHVGRVAERLTELQHLHLARVVTTTHVHLDAHRCLEVIQLRGVTKLIRELADGLIGTKGVESGRLVLASVMPIEAGHSHDHSHSHSHSHSHAHLHQHQHPTEE